MIRTLSPYYVTTSFVSPLTGETCSKYELDVFIWSGAKTSPPSVATYKFEKANFAGSTGNDKIDISRLIDDYIDYDFKINNLDTVLLDSDNQVWVKTQVRYTTADSNDTGINQVQTTKIALKGYALGFSGENQGKPSDEVLMSKSKYKVSRNSVVSIPFIVEDTAKAVTVVSTPLNSINQNFGTVAVSTDSDDIVKVINIRVGQASTDNLITVTIGSRVIKLYVVDEYIYTPVDIYFINQFGGQQTLTFFKERVEKLSVKKETYESNTGQASDGVHQFVDFNVNAKGSFTVASGFVYENLNSDFRELLMSSKVYTYSNGVKIPLNVKTSNFTEKTKAKDKLIQYTVEFSYAYNEINNQ